MVLSQRIYQDLPQPRFKEQPFFITRLLMGLMIDVAHVIASKRDGAADAVWTPLLCGGALGGRGVEPLKLLPGLHLVIAPCQLLAADRALPARRANRAGARLAGREVQAGAC